jgi:hypothetical protein
MQRPPTRSYRTLTQPRAIANRTVAAHRSAPDPTRGRPRPSPTPAQPLRLRRRSHRREHSRRQPAQHHRGCFRTQTESPGFPSTAAGMAPVARCKGRTRTGKADTVVMQACRQPLACYHDRSALGATPIVRRGDQPSRPGAIQMSPIRSGARPPSEDQSSREDHRPLARAWLLKRRQRMGSPGRRATSLVP